MNNVQQNPNQKTQNDRYTNQSSNQNQQKQDNKQTVSGQDNNATRKDGTQGNTHGTKEQDPRRNEDLPRANADKR